MQRDFDLVVTILGALRDAPGPNLSTLDIKNAALAPHPEEQGLQLIAHHMDLLADAGLVKQISETAANAGATRWRITWKAMTPSSRTTRTKRNTKRTKTRTAKRTTKKRNKTPSRPLSVPRGAAGCAA